MRLFTALWPPESAGQHLAAAVDGRDWDSATSGLRGFRLLPPDRWHLTLCFHGEVADATELGDRLEARVADVSAPRLRFHAAGTFRGVLWVAVEPAEDADLQSLAGLVHAAGGEQHGFRAHVTIARWRSGRPTRALTAMLEDYAGPWWTPRDVLLVRSDRYRSGPRYTPLRRVLLPAAAG